MPLLVDALPFELSDSEKRELEALCERWRIDQLELFGAAARGESRKDSDLDLLVTFEPEADWSLWDHARLQGELSSLLSRPVDLVTRRAVERSTNWLRREAILSEARLVYGTETSLTDAFIREDVEWGLGGTD